MTATELLRRADQGRLTLFVHGHDHIIIRGPAAAIEMLRPDLTAHKPELIQELRRRSALADWLVDHASFVVAREAEQHGELAACLACGGSWELHGRPLRAQWRVVDDIEAVELLAVRFVLARAQAILCQTE